jgi:DNA-binding response OmpR family regulator
MKKICVIEDDRWISASLKLYLESSGFEVLVYFSGESASEFIKEQKPNLVILDINLPEKDGIMVCQEVREYSQVPIIMLTARNWEIDRVTWLDSWADDYIAKPFSPRELLARISSILRRVEDIPWETHSDISFWDIHLDQEKAQVFRWSKEILFTKNEYDILEKIWLAGWKLVTRDTLMKEVIGYENYMYDRTIDTHIKNIRKKLDVKDMILTLRGKWYRLNV